MNQIHDLSACLKDFFLVSYALHNPKSTEGWERFHELEILSCIYDEKKKNVIVQLQEAFNLNSSSQLSKATQIFYDLAELIDESCFPQRSYVSINTSATEIFGSSQVISFTIISYQANELYVDSVLPKILSYLDTY